MKNVTAPLLLLALVAYPGCGDRQDDGLRRTGARTHHPVQTSVHAAQAYFDEGLTLVYAYNRDQAVAAFKHAAEADPRLAIARWGEALAQGPNINFPLTRKRRAAALAALGKAQQPGMHATSVDRALIAALAERYTPGLSDEQSAIRYERAMLRAAERFPDDDDVQVLAAESILDRVGADNLYRPNRELAGDTARLKATLRTVLRRSPRHIGANHYWIHLLDASGEPQAALASAEYLRSLDFEPAASHLVHMGSHVLLQFKRWPQIVKDNDHAVALDETLAHALNVEPESLEYYEHNVDFAIGARLMLGRYREANRLSTKFTNPSDPNLIQYAAFQHAWNIVRDIPQPKAGDEFAAATWRYARVMRDIGLRDRDALRQDHRAFLAHLPPQAIDNLGGLGVMTAVEAGSVAFLDGDARLGEQAFSRARQIQASIPADEIPEWRYPLARLLREGRASLPRKH